MNDLSWQEQIDVWRKLGFVRRHTFVAGKKVWLWSDPDGKHDILPLSTLDNLLFWGKRMLKEKFPEWTHININFMEFVGEKHEVEIMVDGVGEWLLNSILGKGNSEVQALAKAILSMEE